MKAYCDHCASYVSYRIEERVESVEVRDRTVEAVQYHAFCNECGEEVYPNDLFDDNIDLAHDAFRISIGAITTERIEEILRKYNIGATPLCRLLGWGPNTIARYLKGTIPDKEHSRRLIELLDTEVMRRLVDARCEELTPVALRKVQARLAEYSQKYLPVDDMLYSTIQFQSTYLGCSSIRDYLNIVFAVNGVLCEMKVDDPALAHQSEQTAPESILGAV